MKLLSIESRRTYAEAAKEIRKELAKFTTVSVIQIVINKLHEDQPWGVHAIPLPWLLCQVLEIAFEITPKKHAKKATHSGINLIVQKLFDLQDIAYKSNHQNVLIDFRKIIVQQSRFHGQLSRHTIFMDRFYSILFMQDGKQRFNMAFQQETGLSLEAFAFLSSYLMAKTIDGDKKFISFEEIVSDIYCVVELEDIAQFIRLIGGTIEELQQIVKEVRKPGRALHASEYFEEPVLVSKPIIIFGDGISTFHRSLLALGISEFVMRLLKKKMPEFKDKFTKLFERYVEELFVDNGINYIHEREIQSWYKTANEAPATDFLLQNGDDCLFIDVKGVEPKQTVLTSSNGNLIKERLKDAHIKAIRQISECAQKLEELSVVKQNVENRFGLIITHQEYFILDATTLLSYLGEAGTPIGENLNGCIKADHVLFCTVSDWEKCLAVCIETNLSVIEFIKFCVKRQRVKELRRFTFEMHVDDFARENGIEKRMYNNWTSEYKRRIESALKNVEAGAKVFWKNSAEIAFNKGRFRMVCDELKRLCLAS